MGKHRRIGLKNRLRRIDDQSDREQTVRQEATDGMDATWSPSLVTDQDQGPE